MPIYHQLGNVPHKRHTVVRRDGALLAEELIGNKGFTGPASLLYHIHQPTPVRAVRKMRDLAWQRDPEPQFRHRHFRTHQLGSGGSLTLDRIPLLFNTDVAMSFVQPTHADEFFYRNAQGDEVVYASQGSGVLETPLGEIAFKDGDYLVIPRGILHRYRFNPGPLKFLVIESTGYVRTPKRYRNEHGQLTEMSPYSERDIRRPVNLPTIEEKGEFRLVVKKESRLFEMSLVYHPFDLVGWDGYYYPFALSIHDFEPRVGRIHLPPPVHQTFEGDGFRRLLVLPAALRLRSGGGAGALQPLERDVRRGHLLRQRRVHEPQGHRVRVDHAASRRDPAWPAPWAHGSVAGRDADRRAGGDGGYLQAVPREPSGDRDRRRRILPFVAVVAWSFHSSLPRVETVM